MTQPTQPRERSELTAGLVLLTEPDGPGARPRVALSSGTWTGHESEAGRPHPFEPAALVPKPPWRAPAAHEALALGLGVPEPETVPTWHVRVGACPDGWRPALDALAHAARNMEIEAARAFLNAPELGPRDELTRLISSASGEGSGVLYHRSYVRSAPGRATVTTNQEGRLLGLHLDAWERAPGLPEEGLRWRMSINLGTAERYFLFVNLTPPQFYAFAREAQVPIGAGVTGTDVGRSFLRRYPEYPVVRVAVRPFEFYLAPTDSIIHDGAMSAAGARDAHATWRGHFRTAGRFGAG